MWGGTAEYLPGGAEIDLRSRCPANAPNTDVLLPGLVLGKVSATKRYATAILGRTSTAVTALSTSLTVPVATAVELARRIGASGTFTITGPPAAAGTVARAVVTYSAVNVTTGVITHTATGVAYIAGSFAQPVDGSDDPVTFIDDGYGELMANIDGVAEDQILSRFLIGGKVYTAKIVDYPTDPSLQAWLKAKLSKAGRSYFTFDDEF